VKKASINNGYEAEGKAF